MRIDSTTFGGIRQPLIALVAAALAASCTLSAGDAARAQEAWVSQTPKKAIWGPTALHGRSLFPTYRDLGVGIYQTQVHWHQIATARPAKPTDPTDPAYRWPSYLAETISEAERHGMQVQLMIIGAPRWSNGDQSWEHTPNEPSDFADFATAAAKKYPSVNLWMIWGEPNREPNFEPLRPAKRRTGRLSAAEAVAPRVYARLLDSAYEALKAVDPANLVIGGNTFTAAGPGAIYTYQWIRYLRLPDGSRPRMDMWGHNPFGFRKPDLNDRPSRRGAVAFGDLRRLARALDRARFPNSPLPLFLSEWGVPIGFEDSDLRYSLKPKEGKKWIRAGLRIARKWERIYTLGWVHPVDTQRTSQGLLDTSGRAKPGYHAFRAG
jgi:hypothetical protein